MWPPKIDLMAHKDGQYTKWEKTMPSRAEWLGQESNIN